MVAASIALAFAAFAILATSSVDAHGTLSKPGLKFTGEGYGGNFPALVPMSALTPQQGDIFTNYPGWDKNAAAFARAFKASKYTSLKVFLLANQDMSKGRFTMPKTPECGFTDPTGGSVQPLPDKVEWYGGKMNHDGPCEIWCDNEIVLPFTANCALTYPEGKFPYEKAACVDKKSLTMYWMSTIMEWQVYIDCARSVKVARRLLKPPARRLPARRRPPLHRARSLMNLQVQRHQLHLLRLQLPKRRKPIAAALSEVRRARLLSRSASVSFVWMRNKCPCPVGHSVARTKFVCNRTMCMSWMRNYRIQT